MGEKTICIVGAGPSGLVTAKTLLHDVRSRGRFRITVFEAQSRIGGLWPNKPDEKGGLVHPHMLVNQSRNTMQLSGLAWGDDSETDTTLEFPRAWQIGQYIERYYSRFCAGEKALTLRLGCRVTHAEPLDGGKQGWKVQVRSIMPGGVDEDAGHFDYLVVSGGYFGKPFVPRGLSLQSGQVEGQIPVVHSSDYRDLATLLHGRKTSSPGGKILIAGGQFSGIEIAGTLATQLSSAINSPGAGTIPDADKYTVHHLIQKPAWVFPLFTTPAPSSTAPPFLPFDLPSYNTLKRPKPLSNTQGHISSETANRLHGIFQTTLGTDQSEISPAVSMKDSSIRDEPPYIGVSDTYLEHVRSGFITVTKGKLESVNGSTATISPLQIAPTASPSEELDNVAAIILATGFSPTDSISYFPASVKETLSYDPTSLRDTVALAFHGTHHPQVPHLAFVGFYRSPYWGVMEMQARLATAIFTSDATTDEPSNAETGVWYPTTMPQWPNLPQALAADKSIERTLSLRTDPRASQFPMGDYMYLMDAFATALGMKRVAVPISGPPPPAGVTEQAAVQMDTLTPAQFVDESEARVLNEDNNLSIAHTKSVMTGGLSEGRFVARAVFRSLQGTWSLDRTLASALPTHPSGRFVGTAEFRLRQMTPDGLSGPPIGDDDLEYLYVEDGTFTAGGLGGPSFRATRRYVWRYRAQTDTLSVWFVRTDDNERADYLFHEMAFDAEKQVASEGWRATAGHLCIKDFYDVQYDFVFRAVNLHHWRLRYAVQGPKKDYTIDGTYRRVPRA